jgi:Tfp pilus assembly protein PilF
MMMKFKNFAAVSLVLCAAACGGGAGSEGVKDPSSAKGKGGQAVSKKAVQGYKVALAAFESQEDTGSWTDAQCASIADKFKAASKEQQSAGGNELPEALYNAGLSYQRCGDDAKATELFNSSLAIDKTFSRAKGQLALYEYKKSNNIDKAIDDLTQIIIDAKYQNVDALVSVASLQMQRGGQSSGPGCSDDMSCAKLNLQRALALNDSFMPAFNQLALYYLNQARGTGPAQGGLVVAGAKKKRANKQRLDLAALVSSQAQKKNANYAPIHNTTGLILVEMEKYNGAVKSFAAARRLNPKLFEAQMNYAAVNLSFRGFKESEEAYRAAIKLRPDTYEAHLGLALALRGQIDFQNAKELVAEAQKELNEAKKLEPKRAEAFYNEAILTEEFRAKRAGEGLEQIPAYQAQLKVYDEAVAQYEGFVQRASGDSNFKEAVEVSKSRIQDIKDTQEFVRESIQFAKDDAKMQAEEKARKAAEAKAAAEAPPAAPADVPAAPAAAAPAP